jgi:hypothetical protein
MKWVMAMWFMKWKNWDKFSSALRGCCVLVVWVRCLKKWRKGDFIDKTLHAKVVFHRGILKCCLGQHMWAEWVDNDIQVTFELYQLFMSGVCGFCESIELKQWERSDFVDENVQKILRPEVVKWFIFQMNLCLVGLISRWYWGGISARVSWGYVMSVVRNLVRFETELCPN